MAAAYLMGNTDLLTRTTAGARGMIAGVTGTGAVESYGNLADYGLSAGQRRKDHGRNSVLDAGRGKRGGFSWTGVDRALSAGPGCCGPRVDEGMRAGNGVCEEGRGVGGGANCWDSMLGWLPRCAVTRPAPRERLRC